MPPAEPAGPGARPTRGSGRRAHLPIDEALAPFAELLRQQLPTPEDIEQAAALRRERRRPGTKARTTGAATALAVAALAAVLWADPVLHRKTLATAVGERLALPLPDGSTVQLNSGAQVEVALHLRSRRLSLERGEAAFEVAHAPWRAAAPWLQRPFTVQAGNVAVQDIGTVFNIRRDLGPAKGHGTDITVQQGSVRVHGPAGSHPVVLHAGQALHTRADAALPGPVPAEAGSATAWQTGRLPLDATPLADAVAEMQRHRRAPIVLADPHAAALRISGQFDLDRLDQLIDLLPRLAPVRVDRLPDGTVVIASRPAHQKP
ncbi:FecR domain-containing protein [Acidovorax sp. SUPP3334]|uniref:FecR family protein n=1 Tax=Acidovorax sp. SUPP3334 TaxID=2920881 RepID=UPI0023DE27BE|nr:FecR domain-containing protein [Acidovorax sp. SUPP3334]GKT22395.1 FecR domain-containing protein [Acidovorax sp. SUPP3334]